MPRGNGTGPEGQGWNQQGGGGRGRGRQGGNRPGSGPGGTCVCPACGATASHTAGVPCYEMKCPQCGTAMRRQ